MRSNTDSTFVGLDRLKDRHAQQIADFDVWAAVADWARFHTSHYDWWTFPIDRPSSFGLQWVVYENEVIKLQRDRAFVDRYLRGVRLVAASWGWDLDRGDHITDPAPDQRWHDWPVRLYKATRSVRLFGYTDVFESLRAYALELMADGASMSYGGHDLGWIFTTGVDPGR